MCTHVLDDWPSDISGKKVLVVNPSRSYWSIKFCSEAALRASRVGAQVFWTDAPLMFRRRLSRYIEINDKDQWRWWLYSCPLKSVHKTLAAEDISVTELRKTAVGRYKLPQSLDGLDSWNWRGYPLGFAIHAAISGRQFRHEIDLKQPGTLRELRNLAKLAVRFCSSLNRLLEELRPDLIVTTNDRVLPSAIALMVSRRLGIDSRVVYWGSQVDSMSTYATSLYSESDHRRHLERMWAEIRASNQNHSRAIQHAMDWQPLSIDIPGSLDYSRNMELRTLPAQTSRRRCVFFATSPWEFSGLRRQENGKFRSQQEALTALLKLLPDEEWEIVLRHHPPHPVLGDVSEPGCWVSVPGIERVVQIMGNSSVDSMELATTADLCVVWVSSIGVRIAAIDKPLLVMGPTYWSEKGFGEIVTDEETLTSIPIPPIGEASLERLAAVLSYMSSHGTRLKHTSGVGSDTLVLGHRVFRERNVLLAAIRRVLATQRSKLKRPRFDAASS